MASTYQQPNPIKVDFSKPNNPISLQPIQPTHASNISSRNSGGTSDILPNERSKATFIIQKMTNILDGGEKKTKRRKFIESPTKNFDYFDKIYQSLPEILSEHIQMYARVHENQQDSYRPTNEEIVQMTRATINKGSIMNSIGLFVPTILTRGTMSQIQEFMMRAVKMQIVGVYAQTELGHGSNVRGLETTAHYDKNTEEFILNTPTLSSIKWWPGTLGKVGTHAIVYAQLILDKEYGIHEFIVQIRDQNHRPMPGIELGDLGPKLGDFANDTGFMRLNNVRIARDRMLSRYQHVTRDGLYVKSQKKSNPRTHYLTMMIARGNMMQAAGGQLSRSATIAVRYSAVRKQGFTDSTQGISYKSTERKILDHQIQLFRCMKQTSTAYAFLFAGLQMSSKFASFDHKVGNKEEQTIKELAATSNGLKALCTVVTHEGIEDCRKCCGGNGYLLASGVALQSADYAQQCTAEGDFVILLLQTSRYLLKRIKKLKEGEKVVGNFEYLNELVEFNKDSQISFSLTEFVSNQNKNIDSDLKLLLILSKLYRRRALLLLNDVYCRFENFIKQGETQENAFNSCSVDLLNATKAHCFVFLVDLFLDKVFGLTEFTCKEVLAKLACLFAISHIIDGSNWCNIFDSQQYSNIKLLSARLLKELRPNAVALVDSFDLPDRVLCSVLGRYDGNVYEALFESAKKSVLNQTDPFIGYEKVLRPQLDLEFLKHGNQKAFEQRQKTSSKL